MLPLLTCSLHLLLQILHLAARTPERLDSDPVLILDLSCCASPSSCGCGRQSLEACIQQEFVKQCFSEVVFFTPGPDARGTPAEFPSHSVSSSYAPPPAPAAPEVIPDVLADPSGGADAPGSSSSGPDVPAIADDPSAAAEPAESLFKHGPRNAADPPSDAAVES